MAKTNLKKTTIQYLEEKNAAKLAIKQKELELESNRQKLESEKLAFQKEKFLLEKEERKALMQLLEKQHILLNSLIEKHIL